MDVEMEKEPETAKHNIKTMEALVLENERLKMQLEYAKTSAKNWEEMAKFHEGRVESWITTVDNLMNVLKTFIVKG